MSHAADGTAAFTGYQRFEGSVGGRRGTFVVRTDGAWDGGVARSELVVVSGSGTDGLAGLAGTGTTEVGSQPPGTLRMDVDLPS